MRDGNFITEIYQRYRAAAEKIRDGASTSIPTVQASTDERQDVQDDTAKSPSVSENLSILKAQAQCLIAASESKQDLAEMESSTVATRLDGLIETARSQFYAYRLDKLPPVWRDIFSDAHVLETHYRLLLRQKQQQQEQEQQKRKKEKRAEGGGESRQRLLDFMSEHLDRAVIVAGKSAGSLGGRWFDDTLHLLEAWEASETQSEESRPTKRPRREGQAQDEHLFSTSEPFGRPQLSPDHTIPRLMDWTLEKFEGYMNDASRHPRPVIFTDQIQDWPALRETPWASRAYLLSKTFGGRRLVPVEIGRSYVDEGWGQELIPFRDFLEKYIDPSSRAQFDPTTTTTVGYLAQHDLFQQIPSLRNDITIPDFCWASVPPHPTDPSVDKPKLEYPQLNAWFGPARTITPLHTDGYHNLLCQVVGTKYVRLYPPTVDREIIRPRGEEMGVSMANTSELDVGVLEGWDERPRELDQVEVDAMRDDLSDIEYWECVLGPGDALLIPIGWWHYVRSLSVSFSVSFWWN